MSDYINLDLIKLKMEYNLFNTFMSRSDSDLNGESEDFSSVFSNALQNTMTGDSSTAASSDGLLSSLLGLYGASFAPAGSATQTSSASQNGITDNVVNFISQHEGYAATAYRGVDYWNRTIGYGHVITEGENLTYLTQQQATDLLKSDLTSYAASVDKEFSDTKLTSNQRDSLISFCYGLGTNIWSKVPKLVSDIKSGASDDVLRTDFTNCDHCGGKEVRGLYNRRLDEWKLFVSK